MATIVVFVRDGALQGARSDTPGINLFCVDYDHGEAADEEDSMRLPYRDEEGSDSVVDDRSQVWHFEVPVMKRSVDEIVEAVIDQEEAWAASAAEG